MDSIKDKYPDLFKKSNLVFGIECDDGWLDLIDAVCAVAASNTKELPTIRQIKEKFGTLRFYADGITPELRGAIRVAEALSAKTCEHCGNKGRTRAIRKWFSTLCRPCAVEKYSEEDISMYEETHKSK